MKTISSERQVADMLKVLGAPFRVRLLLAIGYGEACVCHLEALLKKRQAYISQHLMVLRDKGILETRREGKYMYYRVADPEIFSLIETAAKLLSNPGNTLPQPAAPGVHDNCPCPTCADQTKE
ncbi:MAG TPA: metalloregulator ArsR/SmtB family transcription factor [Anaerolineales bacterium]|nr:metalloregulator ArsR/SmtB family transcription factor [Anaerolineales bacterium]